MIPKNNEEIPLLSVEVIKKHFSRIYYDEDILSATVDEDAFGPELPNDDEWWQNLTDPEEFEADETLVILFWSSIGGWN